MNETPAPDGFLFNVSCAESEISSMARTVLTCVAAKFGAMLITKRCDYSGAPGVEFQFWDKGVLMARLRAGDTPEELL